jgi:hypothetical protein
MYLSNGIENILNWHFILKAFTTPALYKAGRHHMVELHE